MIVGQVKICNQVYKNDFPINITMRTLQFFPETPRSVRMNSPSPQPRPTSVVSNPFNFLSRNQVGNSVFTNKA